MAEFLLQKHSVKGVTPSVISLELKHAMTHYWWPGNVRELENTMRRLIILRDPAIVARDLNARARRKAATATAIRETSTQEVETVLEQVTRANQQAEAIIAALRTMESKRAAALLKVDYKALLYKMKKLGVDSNSKSSSAGGRTFTPSLEAHAS